MHLSVIVPCYDIENYIDRCIRSLRDQDMGPDEYEIIIIDDGSTDGTASVAREHAAADPRVTVLTQPNGGPSAARNTGLDSATGEFVYFVDGDDYIADGSLRPAVEAMREHSLDLGWVGTRRVKPDDPLPAPKLPMKVALVSDVVSGTDYMTEHHWPNSVWSYLLHRPFLDRSGVRFEVGHILEDQLFTANLLVAANRVGTIALDIYRYVLRPGSIMRHADASHAKRLHAEYEHDILGLEELRKRVIADGNATPAFLDRITTYQQGYVFFLISRIIRAPMPLQPAMRETIARLAAGGYYPLTNFPGEDHADVHYRVLAACYNHRLLLYSFALAYRALASVVSHGRQAVRQLSQ